MCELLGITSLDKIYTNDLLKPFFSHSDIHKDGWGIAVLDEDSPRLIREHLAANKSEEAGKLLSSPLCSSLLISHIRRATIGDVDNRNAHPFVKRDITGRSWTLAHNGTIFEGDILNRYYYTQNGTTDSERILLYLIDQIDRHLEYGTDLSDIQIRARLVEDVIVKLAPENKLNLLITDGEYLYVHKNEEKTLYRKSSSETYIFATVPLDQEDWEEVPGNRLFVYKDGIEIYEGDPHVHSYHYNEEKMKMIFMEYASL